MNRRKYLAAISGGAGVVFSGCATIESRLASVNAGSRTIGESSTYKGVRFTPTKYLLTDTLRRNFGNGNGRDETAPSGATFLLTHLSVVHDGDSQQEFPQTMPLDSIDLFYDGEKVNDGASMDDLTNSYTVAGKQLKTYRSALSNAGATGGVYPGTEVDGWVFNEVAANFDPANLELRVIWDNDAFGSDGETTHEWVYSEDTQVSIDDVEGEDSTITM